MRITAPNGKGPPLHLTNTLFYYGAASFLLLSSPEFKARGARLLIEKKKKKHQVYKAYSDLFKGPLDGQSKKVGDYSSLLSACQSSPVPRPLGLLVLRLKVYHQARSLRSFQRIVLALLHYPTSSQHGLHFPRKEPSSTLSAFIRHIN